MQNVSIFKCHVSATFTDQLFARQLPERIIILFLSMHFQSGITGRDFDRYLKKNNKLIAAGNRESTTFTQLRSPVLDLIIKTRPRYPRKVMLFLHDSLRTKDWKLLDMFTSMISNIYKGNLC